MENKINWEDLIKAIVIVAVPFLAIFLCPWFLVFLGFICAVGLVYYLITEIRELNENDDHDGGTTV